MKLTVVQQYSCVTIMHVRDDRRRRVLALATSLEELEFSRDELILQLEFLDARKRAIKLEHNALLNMDAPTSNFPDEVLAMVFEAGLEIQPDPIRQKKTTFKITLSEPYPTPIHFGDLVSHVSHRWRSIALATPRLWKHIRCTRRGQWREIATDHLCKSRSSPVDIYINSLRRDDFTLAFLQLLTRHLRHCQQLFIRDVPKAVVPFLVQCLSTPAPLLRTFSIGSEGGMTFEDPGFLPFGAPCLANADLHGIYPPRLHPMFASVTSLRMTCTSIDTTNDYALLRDSLMGVKSLNLLEIQFKSYHRPATTYVILLPTVQFLHVGVMEDMYPSHVNDFLGNVQAPSLISLSLNKWQVNHPHSSDPDKFPSLRHLILYDCDIGMGEAHLSHLPNLARQFPYITRFTSQIGFDDSCRLQILLRAILGERCSIYDKLQTMLGNSRDAKFDGTPWPNLQTVAVADPYDSVVDLTLVPNLISRLQDAGHPLCKLLISEAAVAQADKDIMEELEELIEIERFNEDWPMPFERGR